ncbi:MAG: hypothetical protein IJV77_03670 [Clostridia bacterium]|nr:hypothetical protein [Clostridia bacterium]
MDAITSIIIFIFFFAVIISFAVFVIYWSRKGKDLTEDGYTQEEYQKKLEEESRTEPLVEFFDAIVKDKKFDHYITGIHTANSILNFIVTFETDQKKIFEFVLSEEWFKTLKIGQKGVLLLVNGKFADFGEGQDIHQE